MHPDLLQALRRIERKGRVPVRDLRLIFRGYADAPDRGDPISEALVSHGWALRDDDDLVLTDHGRRALAAHPR